MHPNAMRLTFSPEVPKRVYCTVVSLSSCQVCLTLYAAGVRTTGVRWGQDTPS